MRVRACTAAADAKAHAFDRAREQLDFLIGFASTQSGTDGIWHIAESCWLVGTSVSSASEWHPRGPFARSPERDEVALAIALRADDLSKHLPLVEPRWRTTGLLLKWLRDASKADPATKLILCDRVVEQTAGWCGYEDPQSFVASSVRTDWILARLLKVVDKFGLSCSTFTSIRGPSLSMAS